MFEYSKKCWKHTHHCNVVRESIGSVKGSAEQL